MPKIEDEPTGKLLAELEAGDARFAVHTDLKRIERGLPTMAQVQHKSREVRLRRMADRRGYRLVKSRSRDPHAVDYGLYALLDIRIGCAVNPAIAQHWVCSWTLDEVEEWLTG